MLMLGGTIFTAALQYVLLEWKMWMLDRFGTPFSRRCFAVLDWLAGIYITLISLGCLIMFKVSKETLFTGIGLILVATIAQLVALCSLLVLTSRARRQGQHSEVGPRSRWCMPRTLVVLFVGLLLGIVRALFWIVVCICFLAFGFRSHSWDKPRFEQVGIIASYLVHVFFDCAPIFITMVAVLLLHPSKLGSMVSETSTEMGVIKSNL